MEAPAVADDEQPAQDDGQPSQEDAACVANGEQFSGAIEESNPCCEGLIVEIVAPAEEAGEMTYRCVGVSEQSAETATEEENTTDQAPAEENQTAE